MLAEVCLPYVLQGGAAYALCFHVWCPFAARRWDKGQPIIGSAIGPIYMSIRLDDGVADTLKRKSPLVGRASVATVQIEQIIHIKYYLSNYFCGRLSGLFCAGFKVNVV